MLGMFLGNSISKKMITVLWDQICAQLKQAGSEMIEDPDALVRFLRQTADAIEKRKDFFNGGKGTEQVD